MYVLFGFFPDIVAFDPLLRPDHWSLRRGPMITPRLAELFVGEVDFSNHLQQIKFVPSLSKEMAVFVDGSTGFSEIFRHSDIPVNILSNRL